MKQTLFVSEYPVKDHGVVFDVMSLARFAFGTSIGSIDSLMGGKELQIIKENDLKSSKMSLVRTVIALPEASADLKSQAHKPSHYNEDV